MAFTVSGAESYGMVPYLYFCFTIGVERSLKRSLLFQVQRFMEWSPSRVSVSCAQSDEMASKEVSTVSFLESHGMVPTEVVAVPGSESYGMSP
jgi:hypothetical protein